MTKRRGNQKYCEIGNKAGNQDANGFQNNRNQMRLITNAITAGINDAPKALDTIHK